ncbi:MAG: tetratricopeptide repeat protein [Planctomycetes bacterium]|nr:tetratricopeptide repeat protein [Planctomycetota bacterium]
MTAPSPADDPLLRGARHLRASVDAEARSPRELRAAIAAFGQRLHENAGDVAARWGRALACLEKGRQAGEEGDSALRSALSDYEDLVRHDPASPVYRNGRALANFLLAGPQGSALPGARAHIEAAIADWIEAVRLEASIAEYHAQLGLARWRLVFFMDDLSAAREICLAAVNDYSEAIRLEPGQSGFYDGRALMRLHLHKGLDKTPVLPLAEAQSIADDLGRALTLDPLRKDLRGRLGLVLFEVGVARAQADGDPLADWHTALAVVQDSDPADDAALRVVHEIISIVDELEHRSGDPSAGASVHGAAFLMRHTLLTRRNLDPGDSLVQARRYFEIARRDRPTSVPVLANLASVLSLLGDHGSAIPLIEEALKLAPGHPVLRSALEKLKRHRSGGS